MDRPGGSYDLAGGSLSLIGRGAWITLAGCSRCSQVPIPDMNARTMSDAVLYESHCHTPLCRHATGEPKEYAAAALRRGLAGITFTCHGPTPREWGYCMWRHEWPKYLRICEEARFAFAGQIDVRTGVECDYLPDLEGYWAEFLGENQLSHVLGSVHPHVDDYRNAFWNDDAFEYQKTYFEHLARAAETRLFDTLSHPDLVKNVTQKQWDMARILPFVQRALDRIAAAGTAMELNTSGLLKAIPESNPGPEILREMEIRGIPVVLGSDAHNPGRVADGFEQALDLLRDCGFEKVSFFVSRRRQEVDLAAARLSLLNAPEPGTAE